MLSVWSRLHLCKSEGEMSMGGPPQWHRTEPIPIWSDFWRGFGVIWKQVLSGLPIIFRFWDWDWEAVGYIAGMMSVAAIIIGSLAAIFNWVFP